MPSIRRRAYEILEDAEVNTGVAKIVRRGLTVLIVISVAMGVLETVPGFDDMHRWLFLTVEISAALAFAVEYAVRIWCCVEDRSGRYEQPVSGRLRYMVTPSAIIDLLAILPVLLLFFAAPDLRFLRLLRILRVLKLTRHSSALSTFEVVIYNERRALLSGLLVFFVVLTIAAGLMYSAERTAQPDHFASIPQAMYWAAVTLTTVGYGDVTPVTPLGKLIASLTALCGIGALAFPTAILGAGLMKEQGKAEFLARAAMVARVPLFRRMPPAKLAEVATMLHLRSLPARYTVIRRGEQPEAMYFIDAGKAVLIGADARAMLGPGQFFGESSLIEGKPRQHTVVTFTACRLLTLEAADFYRLMASDAELQAEMLAHAHEFEHPMTSPG